MRCATTRAGRGYPLLRYAFTAPEVHRVEIRCDPRNHARERAIRKAGLKKVGHLRKIVRHHDGRLCDRLVYAKMR